MGVNERARSSPATVRRRKSPASARRWSQESGPLRSFPTFLSPCLSRARQTLPKIIRSNGINVSAEVVPVIRQMGLYRRAAILQRFNDVEVRQNELRGNQSLHKGYYAKYGFEDVIRVGCHPQDPRTLTRMAGRESHPADRRDRHRQGAVRPRRSPGLPPGGTGRFWPSTWRLFPENCWKASCSAMRGLHRRQKGGAWASLSWPTGAHCFWTRWRA